MIAFKKCLAIPIAAALLSVPIYASAQGIMQIVTYHMNPSSESRFVAAVTTVKETMEETNGSAYWLAAQSASGSSSFMIAVPHASFTELGSDPLAVLGDVLTQEELGALGENMQASVSHVSRAFYANRPDLGRAAPATDAVPDAVVTIEIEVAAGRNSEFEDWARKVVEATEATAPGAYHTMMSPVFGTNNYLAVVIIPKWADLDGNTKSVQQRILEHFGQREGQRMLEENRSVVLGTTTNLWRTRAEIARPPVE